MAATLERGYLLHKRYRIVEILGQGGMGNVYRAVDENLGVDVAVKENLFTTDEFARQFRLEAVILANLRQVNLPRVTDHFVINEQGQYLIMDYIEGEDLRQRMEMLGAISEEEVVLIGAAICDALQYLHTRKPSIIHRDLKPGNVRITPDGHIYLVDFGLAKLVRGNQSTSTGARAMTPGYSPPEQYGTARTDPRTDVYSLGATLYAAVTGVIPEDGLARAMDNLQLTPLRKRNPRVGRRLAAVIEKAMSIHPEDRFQSAEEFKQALLTSNIKTQRRDSMVVTAPAPQVTEEDEALLQATPASEDKMEEPAPPPVRIRKGKKTGGWTFLSLLLVTLLLAVFAIVYFWSTISVRLIGFLATATTQSTQEMPAGETSLIESLIPTRTHTAMWTPVQSSTLTNTHIPTETLLPTPTWKGGGFGQLAIASTQAGLPQIYLVNSDASLMLDGNLLVQLTSMPEGACQPEWEPSGLRLVFISPCEKRQSEYPDARIFIAEADGSNPVEVAIPGGGFEPAWSPDGQRIAFTSDLSGSYQIYIYNLESNQITALTERTGVLLPDWSRHPAWSRSGTQIVYTGHSQLTDAPQIWIMSDSGEEKTRLVQTAVEYWDFQPTWSLDGRMIYFSETRGPQQLGWLMQYDYENRDNPDANPVFNGNYATDITLSPDMRWMAFESTRDGLQYGIYLMTTQGKDRRLLFESPFDEFDPAWRPISQP